MLLPTIRAASHTQSCVGAGVGIFLRGRNGKKNKIKEGGEWRINIYAHNGVPSLVTPARYCYTWGCVVITHNPSVLCVCGKRKTSRLPSSSRKVPHLSHRSFFDLFIIIIKIEMSDFVKIPFDFPIF